MNRKSTFLALAATAVLGLAMLSSSASAMGGHGGGHGGGHAMGGHGMGGHGHLPRDCGHLDACARSCDGCDGDAALTVHGCSRPAWIG